MVQYMLLILGLLLIAFMVYLLRFHGKSTHDSHDMQAEREARFEKGSVPDGTLVHQERDLLYAATEEDLALSAKLAKAGQSALGLEAGVPEQGELAFADEDVASWDEMIKQSYEQRIEEGQSPEHHVIAPTHQYQFPQGYAMLYVKAAQSGVFLGERILEALRSYRMVYGKKQIFHHYDRQGQCLFSASSAIDPGSFDLESIHFMTTPGLIFFVDLPNCPDCTGAFKAMFQTASEVAFKLGGELLDMHQAPIDKQNYVNYVASVSAYVREDVPA